MNPFLKFVLIAVAAVAVLFAVLLGAVAVIVPIKFPPEKLKAMATQQLSDSLKRKVTIGDVHFSVFSGFDISDLKITNRPGWAETPFVTAKDISISYHLIPLIWGELTSGATNLGEIRLNEPQILVEKRAGGQFNFSDITGGASTSAVPPPAAKPAAKGKAKPKKKAKKHAALPVPVDPPATSSFFVDQAWAESPASAPAAKSGPAVSVDGIDILHGKIVYKDESVSPAQQSIISDLNFSVKNLSLTGGKTTFMVSTPFSVNNVTYQFASKGTLRYDQAGQSVKEAAIDGTLNDLGFRISGSADHLTDNFSPNMDGEASLDMLKLSGLVPKNLASMPSGLTMTGPAKVDFHLAGSKQKGLELSGTADASGLAITYKDLFVKQAKGACKLEFKSVVGPDFYDLPSFKAVYGDWEFTGSFHYKNGSAYSFEMHSKDLPLSGLSTMVPRWKGLTVAGTVGVNMTVSEQLNQLKTLKVNGLFSVKGLDVSDAADGHFIPDLSGNFTLKSSPTHIPSVDMAFNMNGFGGTLSSSVNLNMASPVLSYAYAINMKNVAAQPVVNAGVILYGDKAFDTYKNSFYGNANFDFKGTGSGTATEVIEKTMAASGNYNLQNGKLKMAAIKTMNSYIGDNSDEVSFETISGTLAVKNRLINITCNTQGKVGKIQAAGGITMDGNYQPEMKVMCDIHKEFINSDAVKSKLPDALKGQWDVNRAADSNGLVPIDFHLRGSVSKTPGLDCVDIGRLANNILHSYTKDAQNKAQDAGKSLIKGLFGH